MSANSDIGRWPIPPSWKWVKINDVAEIIGGGTPKNSGDEANYSPAGIPWLTPADLTGNTSTYVTHGRRNLSEKGFLNSSARIMPAGTVLLSSRAPIGYCVIARKPICTNQGFKSFILTKHILPEFVRYYLIAAKDYLHACASGTTFLELSGSTVAQVELPVPPAAEQRRIAEKIDELFSLIEAGERALARARKLLERYRQSVLNAAVTGELTKDWRERHQGEIESGEALLNRILKARRAAWEKAELVKLTARGKPPTDTRWKQKYKEPHPPDTSTLPKLPDGWVWASLDQLTSHFGNGLSRKPNHSPPGTPILRISAMRSLSVDPEDCRFYPADCPERLEEYVLQPGDLLFTRYNGSPSLVGVCGAVRFDKPVLFPDKVMRGKLVSKEIIIPDFIEVCANVGSSRLFIEKNIKTSAGQHGISGADVKATAIPLPPVREQLVIAELVEEHLSYQAQTWHDVARGLKSTIALRQSILAAAFSGRLVPQDPTDEPASALLARIREERAHSAAKPTKRLGTGRRRRGKSSQLSLGIEEPGG